MENLNDPNNLTVAEAIENFFVHRKLMEKGLPRDQWYKDNWVRIPIRGYRIPILPIHGFKTSFILHDMHHVVTDYDINIKGELEISAWELASGGCGHFYLFWVDRFIFMTFGLIVYPRATIAAFRYGRKHKNLFKRKIDEVMKMQLHTLQEELGINIT
ncbi:MAG: hypothetical protein COA79_07335 [Planctomycetota bacterium]|nr:MAG: hypothetical protein COA79_07335 [Planctomycetota bacterium]